MIPPPLSGLSFGPSAAHCSPTVPRTGGGYILTLKRVPRTVLSPLKLSPPQRPSSPSDAQAARSYTGVCSEAFVYSCEPSGSWGWGCPPYAVVSAQMRRQLYRETREPPPATRHSRHHMRDLVFLDNTFVIKRIDISYENT